MQYLSGELKKNVSVKDRILICQVTLSLRQIVFGTWNRKDKYISAVLSFRKCKSHWCLFICTLFLATIVYSCTWHTWPMQITAPTSMHLSVFLLSCFSSSLPIHCLTFTPFFHYLTTSFKSSSLSFSVSLSIPLLLHWVMKHRLHGHVLLHTFRNPWRQAISGYFTADQCTNSVTLLDVSVQAGSLSLSHTHTLFCFGITCVSLTCHNW